MPQRPQLKVDRDSIGFGLEFGSCTRLGTAPPDHFKLENGGLEDLIITSAVFSGDGVFTVEGPPKTTLKGNEITFIQVIFTPLAEKTYKGTILVVSNAEPTDGGGPMKTLTVSGRGCVVSADGG